MPLPKNDPHVDWSRLGKATREEIEAEAVAEMKALGITGRYTRFRAYVEGKCYDVPIPDVRAIREQLKLSQVEFAKRYFLSHRTVQQWEQHRAMPDMPARILLRAIERHPKVIAEAAADVAREFAIAQKSDG